MFFLNPIYLWGFLGIAVPIVIHLWSKKEGQTIKVGSTKLLQEADSKQSRSIKMNEWWLLLLRMLIVSFVVLILAEPQLKKVSRKLPIIYVVESSLLSDDGIRTIVDSINSDIPVKLLQSGFPDLQLDDLEEGDISVPLYWQLAKEMEELPADSIVVFSNAFVQGVKGARPEVNQNINWIVLDSENSVKELLQVAKKEDGVEVISLVSDHQHLSYEKEIIPLNSNRIEIHPNGDSIQIPVDAKDEWIPLKVEEPLEVIIYYDDSLEDQSKYLEFSFAAIAKFLQRQVKLVKLQDVDSLKGRSPELLVWLSQDSVVKANASKLLYKPDSLATDLIEIGRSKDIFYLTGALDTETIVETHLPEQLLKLLDLHPDLEEKINSQDKRVMAREELLPRSSFLETDKKYTEILNFTAWLWLLLLTTLVAERIVAYYRKQ